SGNTADKTTLRAFVKKIENQYGKADRIWLMDRGHAACGMMQSIFRSAARREALGKHSKGDSRDAGLKMDWTKPLPRAWPMCIECRLDLGRETQWVGDGKRAEAPGRLVGRSNGLSQCRRTRSVPWKNVRNEPRGCSAPVAWPGQAWPPQFYLHPGTVLFIMRYQ